MGMFAAVSNDTQHALAIMLEDENFVDKYVKENNRLVSSVQHIGSKESFLLGMWYIDTESLRVDWISASFS